MNKTLMYASLCLFGTFVSAISQVVLKKSAQKTYPNVLAEYLNAPVIFAYVLFVGATLLSVIAYRVIPLSMGPILESTGYIYVAIFGVTIFHERMTARKLLALAIILCGIAIYAIGLG